MQIRAAAASDLEQLVALYRDDELASGRGYPDEVTPEIEAAFAAIDADPNNELFVATDGARIIGTFQLTFLPGLTFNGAARAQIEAVRVSSRLRGRGIGREMMEWAIEHARTRGAQLVQLMSESSREAAHRFYISLGFAPSHTGFKRRL